MSETTGQEEGNLFFAENEDKSVNRAMEKARETLAYFRESLLNPRPEQEVFALKAKIVDGDEVEHIWLSDVSYDEDGHFYGIISNEPEFVKNIQSGARVGVDAENVSDWMLIEKYRLIGGYTIRAYRDRLSPGEQEDFDEDFGWVIDEGVDHYPHTPETPEGAILALEDAYSAEDIERAVRLKSFDTEARHMLARMPELPQGEEMMEQTVEALETAFRSFFGEEGMPDFEGVERAFPEREYEDENTVLVTEICTHPDGQKTMDKLWVYKVENQWFVGPPANEDP